MIAEVLAQCCTHTVMSWIWASISPVVIPLVYMDSIFVLTGADLVLFQHMELKFPLPISKNRHTHISKAGAQRFVTVAVTAVICVFVLIIVSAVAQLIIQLDLQTILHKFDNGLFEQILDVIHATDVCHLQQLADLLSPSIFFRGAILSGYIVNLLCGASILHHAGGLHIVWDCLRVPDPPLSVRTTKGRIRYSRCAHIPHTSDRELGERGSLKHCKFPTQNMGSELIS